jgi:hypothetical protein
MEPINQLAAKSLNQIEPKQLKTLSDVCFAAGFASILLSILAWAIRREEKDVPHGERFGIFIGMWAPTFFILSNRFERYAERVEAGKSA